MMIFKRNYANFSIIFLVHLIFLTISIDAIERKVVCKKSNKDPKINDINYEFHANSPHEICDEDDSIFPTATLTSSINDYESTIDNDQSDALKDIDGSSTRKQRSENTDEIVPMNLLKFDPQHPLPNEERKNNNPNADIQDIITGIVKLLNGNVNVHANTQYSPPPTRRYATRINNRGPPRISDMPIILPGIDDKFSNIPQKTTVFPNGMRKPPTVPYPFDMPPPEKPHRNEHPIMIAQNKPIPTNRPPWHGSRTRSPIQISQTNRLQMPSRISQLPSPQSSLSQSSQDLRLPNKTINPMIAFNTRIPEINKMSDLYPNEKPVSNLMEQMISKPNIQTTTESLKLSKEITKKPDLLKKTTEMPVSSPMPTIESSKNVPEMPVSVETPTSPSLPVFEKSTESNATPFIHLQNPSTQSNDNDKTPELIESSIRTTQASSSFEIKSTTESMAQDINVKSTISPSRVQKPIQQIESTDFKSFYARPGIVLDDTDYTPGAPGILQPSTQPTFHHIHQNTGVPSSATLSNIYAEIFDVTLSAIQGQPHHNKVVDLIEIGNTDTGATDVTATRLYGTDGNDIIVSASDDNSFVSIDGKRTYINLFGETAETEQLKKPLKTQNDHRIYASKTVTPYGEKTNSIPTNRGKPVYVQKPLGNYTTSPQTPFSMRYNYRTKPQQNAVRIDTCIVGDDSTCDIAQNEICKTDLGVSSCHCRPGYSRRKYRDPCRRVVSLIMSMRIDKYYDKPIVWDKVFADINSEQFEHMNFEALRAVDSVMSMTPFSDDFISARVHNIYAGNASQGSPGVYVNMTIQLDGNTESARNYIQLDFQKQLIAVIHRRNNNIGNSALYVDQPAGSISSLHDLNECSSAELNDCHPNANCTNVWGTFQCKCAPGLRDPWSDQMQRAGRECISCSNTYCNNRGTCQYDESGIQLICICANSYYGSQCEIDGDILIVSIGASIIAVVIILLTLVCLVMWGRRWNQEQKEMAGSPIFNYITRANLDTHMKTIQSKTYQAALEDRMRWAQIADVMAQSNHYAVEPVSQQRVQPAPLYVYQNMHHPNTNANLTSLSMAGTLPVRNRGINELSVPISRMELESKMRRHEHTSSSEEDDLVDLLGSNTYQSPAGIYYDVDCESSDQQHGTSTLQSNLESGGPLYSLSNAPRVPMSTYTPNPRPRMYPRN